MIGLTKLQEKTLDLIKNHFKKSEINSGEINNVIGLGNYEKYKGVGVRQIVHALREKGYPICANQNGYYYARSDWELSSYIVSLERRLAVGQMAVDGLYRAFKNGKTVLYRTEGRNEKLLSTPPLTEEQKEKNREALANMRKEIKSKKILG